MVNFQKERMEYIVNKEQELTQKQQKLLLMEDCNNNLNKYKSLLNKITEDLTNNTNNMNNLLKYTEQTNISINNDINKQLNKLPQTIDLSIQPEINNVNEHFDMLDMSNLLDLPIDEVEPLHH
jgi:chromosome segregation ATPase